MNNQPLISILIPTKNRPEFIDKLIDCYKYFANEDRIEFIFHENISNSSHLFKDLDSKIFRHIYVPENLSMSENFTGAIKAAKGKYVLITGDDDFILPEIINVTEFMQDNNICAAVSPVVSYLWPGVESKIGGANDNGKLFFYPFKNKPTLHNTHNGLKKILDNGGAFFSYEIPSIYQGVVEKNLIININKEFGTCFPGFSPDLASAIAISTKIKTFVKWSSPFVVSGASIGSGSAEGYEHTHKGSLSERKYIVDQIDEWPIKVPKYFSAQTIYSASTYISLKTFYPKENFSINYDALYAGLLVFNFKESLKLIKGKTSYKSWPKIFLFLLKLILNRVTNLSVNILYNLILPKLRNEEPVNTPEKAFIEISKKYKMV